MLGPVKQDIWTSAVFPNSTVRTRPTHEHVCLPRDPVAAISRTCLPACPRCITCARPDGHTCNAVHCGPLPCRSFRVQTNIESYGVQNCTTTHKKACLFRIDTDPEEREDLGQGTVARDKPQCHATSRISLYAPCSLSAGIILPTARHCV